MNYTVLQKGMSIKERMEYYKKFCNDKNSIILKGIVKTIIWKEKAFLQIEMKVCYNSMEKEKMGKLIYCIWFYIKKESVPDNLIVGKELTIQVNIPMFEDISKSSFSVSFLEVVFDKFIDNEGEERK